MSDSDVNSLLSSLDGECEKDDHKIMVHDERLLIDVCKHIAREVEDFAAERVPSALATQFAAGFEEMFLQVIKENVIVSDQENSTESYAQPHSSNIEKDKTVVVNQSLLPKLGETLVELQEKRKRYPFHCSQILQQQFKKERKNLMEGPKFDFRTEKHDYIYDDNHEEVAYIKQKLISGFESMTAYNRQVETEISATRKLEQDTTAAMSIYKKEKQHIAEVFGDPNKDNPDYKTDVCFEKVLPSTFLQEDQ